MSASGRGARRKGSLPAKVVLYEGTSLVLGPANSKFWVIRAKPCAAHSPPFGTIKKRRYLCTKIRWPFALFIFFIFFHLVVSRGCVRVVTLDFFVLFHSGVFASSSLPLLSRSRSRADYPVDAERPREPRRLRQPNGGSAGFRARPRDHDDPSQQPLG